MISVKEIIFLLLIFLMFLTFAKFTTLNYISNPNISILVNGIIFTLLIFLFSKILKDSKDSFNFEVTPAKLCDGGPYMYSSNPERQKLCANTNTELVSCGVGFRGRPNNFAYNTSFSDNKWENNTC